MTVLRRNFLKLLSHGLAVIALALFITPLDNAHAEPHVETVAEWTDEHVGVDEHDHHADLEDILEHCDPGPDCSSSYAFFNSLHTVVAVSRFRQLNREVVGLSTGQIIPKDIPPPKVVS
ncbi:MAG: hypothetical protein P8L68_13395 [Paracoccaceae bacterium]|nr:hypothetical protein [Paracoccaceae bacterium]MDG2259477.1 hypothetical protein [Paracoccaceae bacterium]